MKITNPRRVLAVGHSGSGLPDLIRGLTGLHPSHLNNGIIAGTTHNLDIETDYYTATIPIWLDEMASPTAWSAEFLQPEAREVLQAVGAFILCFKKPVDQKGFDGVHDSLKCLANVVKEGCGIMWDGVCLAVAMPQTLTPYFDKSFDDWEALCQEFGFEFIDFEMKGRNQFSELCGLERLKEALESNNWESDFRLEEDSFGLEDLEDLEEIGNEDSFSSGLQFETTQMQKEMQELREAMRESQSITTEVSTNNEDEVEQLESMIFKMQAARDMSIGLPIDERKRIAVKAVSEVVKFI